MKAKQAVIRASALLGIGALTLAPVGCTRNHILRLDPKPSLLAVLLDSDSSSARAEFRGMLALTTRPNEHVIVIDADTGLAIGSFLTPSGPGVSIPSPPASLPQNPTSFEVSSHRHAIARYDAELRHAEATVQRRWQGRLGPWVASVIASTRASRDSKIRTVSETRGFERGLASVAADISSLEQVGVQLGSRKTLAILGLDGVPTKTSPVIPGGLGGSTTVVTDFSGSTGAQATWQAALSHAGAVRAVMLTQPTGDELPVVVEEGLNH